MWSFEVQLGILTVLFLSGLACARVHRRRRRHPRPNREAQRLAHLVFEHRKEITVRQVRSGLWIATVEGKSAAGATISKAAQKALKRAAKENPPHGKTLA